MLLTPPIFFSILGFTPSLTLLNLPESRVGGPWFRMDIPLLTPSWISQIISLIDLLYFEPLQLDPGSEHPWDTCSVTSLKWGCNITSSGTRTSPVMIWAPCPTPTHSYWSPYIPCRFGIMRWSRGWIFASKCMNSFQQKWRYCSSITQYLGCIWGHCVWTGTS